MYADDVLKKAWPDWTIVDKIGEGSYGEVYHIRRQEFGQIFDAAMKWIRIPKDQSEIGYIKAQFADDASTTEYFRSIVKEFVNEFVLMERLKGHTNIVSYEDHKVLPHQEDPGWDILIRMELLTSFTSYMSQTRMAEAEVIRFGIEMCSALELCHNHNIIHRDIKPQNIFVTKDGSFKLGDFGVARTVERTLSSMTVGIGTKAYMAPEVLKGERYNHTADIYSLGVLMYSLLNDNRGPFMPPFGEKITPVSKDNAFRKRMSGEEPAPPVHGSREIKNLISKAYAFDLTKRYPSATIMKEELIQLQNVQGLKETQQEKDSCKMDEEREEDWKNDLSYVQTESVFERRNDSEQGVGNQKEFSKENHINEDTVSVFSEIEVQDSYGKKQREEDFLPNDINIVYNKSDSEIYKRTKIFRFTVLSACFCIVMAVMIFINKMSNTNKTAATKETTSEKKSTIVESNTDDNNIKKEESTEIPRYSSDSPTLDEDLKKKADYYRKKVKEKSSIIDKYMQIADNVYDDIDWKELDLKHITDKSFREYANSFGLSLNPNSLGNEIYYNGDCKDYLMILGKDVDTLINYPYIVWKFERCDYKELDGSLYYVPFWALATKKKSEKECLEFFGITDEMIEYILDKTKEQEQSAAFRQLVIDDRRFIEVSISQEDVDSKIEVNSVTISNGKKEVHLSHYHGISFYFYYSF